MAAIRRVFKKTQVKSTTSSKKSDDFGVKGAPINTQHPFYFGFLFATGALFAIALLQALQSASQVFILIIISLFLAMGLNPAVSTIESRGARRGVAVSIVVISVLLVVAGASLIVTGKQIGRAHV